MQVESEPSRALLSKGVSVFGTDTAHTKNIMHQLGTQLDRFKRRHLFLGQFEMLGHAARRKGGMWFVVCFLTMYACEACIVKTGVNIV